MFSSQKVLDKLESLDVLLVKADSTEANAQIDADLKRYGADGRASLPVNIIVPRDPDKPLIIMPELIGPDEALQALEKATE